jgi:hypothetical protein
MIKVKESMHMGVGREVWMKSAGVRKIHCLDHGLRQQAIPQIH